MPVERTAWVQAQRQDRDLLKACPWTLAPHPALFPPRPGARPWETPTLNRRCPGSDSETLTAPPIHALVPALGLGVLQKMSQEGFVLAGVRPVVMLLRLSLLSLRPCGPPSLLLPASSQAPFLSPPPSDSSVSRRHCCRWMDHQPFPLKHLFLEFASASLSVCILCDSHP